MVVKVLQTVIGADERFDIFDGGTELYFGVKRTVRVKDHLYLAEERINVRTVDGLHVRSPQATVVVFAARAAAQADYKLVILFHQPESFLAVADLAQVELRLNAQISVAGMAPDSRLDAD